jgi:uncharacterized repeat protein (TIGR02543 family)
MSPQSFTYGTAQNLRSNAFSRTGWTFQGWAASGGGGVAYSNNQSVSNLSSAKNGTVTLYAVWEADPPAAPSAPQLAPGNTQIAVSWSAVNKATAYEVWYGTNSSSSGATQYGGDISAPNVTIPDLGEGIRYYVWIKAKNPGGVSPFGSSASAVVNINAPISFSLAESDDITLSTTSVTLSRGSNTSISVSGSYTSYTWYLNGGLIENAASSNYTFATSALLLGNYELAVKATKTDGLTYSGRCVVTVE